jgi:hypothetical protein
MEEKDCFVKDEGDFFTLGFQSEKAKQVLSNNADLKELSYSIGGNVQKVDLPVELLKDTFVFLVENHLTYDSEY